MRLNGLCKRCPAWGKTLMSVASNMCNVRSYYTYGKPMTVRSQRVMLLAHVVCGTQQHVQHRSQQNQP